jgi:hypothetical protein
MAAQRVQRLAIRHPIDPDAAFTTAGGQQCPIGAKDHRAIITASQLMNQTAIRIAHFQVQSADSE